MTNKKPVEGIVALSYKGKWFTLADKSQEDDFEAPYIDVSWAIGDGLPEHVQNCRYYGIPAYIGDNADLTAKIEKLNKVIDLIEEQTNT